MCSALTTANLREGSLKKADPPPVSVIAWFEQEGESVVGPVRVSTLGTVHRTIAGLSFSLGLSFPLHTVETISLKCDINHDKRQ